MTHSNTVVTLNSFNNIIITRKVSAKEDTFGLEPKSEVKQEKFPREAIKLKKKTSPHPHMMTMSDLRSYFYH